MPKGVVRKFSSEEGNQIISDYQNGISTTKLGIKNNCDPKVIARFLRSKNINILSRPYKLNNYILEQFINDYIVQGMTYSQLEKKHNIERECIASTLIRYGVARREATGIRHHKLNDNFFEVIDTEEKAYWLGFLTTDGYVTKGNTERINTIGIHLAGKDIGHLEKFKKAIDSNYKVHINKSNNNSVCYTVVSEKMVADLRQYGVVICKTGRTYYPEGMIPNLCGDYKLVEAFKQYCSSLGIEGNFKRDFRVHTNFWSHTFYGKKSLKIMDHLYDQSSEYLIRKMAKYNLLKEKCQVIN